MAKYDLVDGGIAATFLDGPKKGHVGVVDIDREGAPVASLTFLTDLVYTRAAKVKVDAVNAMGQAVAYRGVAYRVEPRCGFMVRMQQEIEAAVADSQAGKVETQ